MLAAAIGAAGDVDAELLLEAGDAVVELGGEPTGEAFGFGEREFAKLGSGAGDGGASESGGAHRQSGGGEFTSDATALRSGMFTMTRFCITVLRMWPSPYRSERSAARRS